MVVREGTRRFSLRGVKFYGAESMQRAVANVMVLWVVRIESMCVMVAVV